MPPVHDHEMDPARPRTGGSAPAPGDAPNASADDLLSLLWQQASDHAFVLLDTAGVVAGWRGGAAAVFGYSEQEAMGRPISFIFTEEDEARGLPMLERLVAAAEGRADDDRWHVRKDGTRIWITGTLVPLRRNGTLQGFAKIMRNRTDLRTQIETLKNRAQRAESQLTERDAFFARTAHEIRNSLGPLRNAAELVGRAPTPGDSRFPLAIIARQIGLLQRLANDLADMARVGAGKLQLSKSSFDLVADLREIAGAVRERAAQKGQDLRVLMPAAAIAVFADRQRVHQIAFNLLDNALKYTPEGGRIWLKCTIEGRSAVFRVEDDGIGIPPDVLPLIFELFTQEAPLASEGGLGVGLSLVKELVTAHGGVVEVRSDGRGKGSEFTVRLPLEQAGS